MLRPDVCVLPAAIVDVPTEAGFNFVFFKNRLRLDGSIYQSRTYNQFFERTLSSTTGYKSEVVNGGRVDNKGIELSLRFEDKWGNFGWSSYLTYSLNRNKVVELLRMKCL